MVCRKANVLKVFDKYFALKSNVALAKADLIEKISGIFSQTQKLNPINEKCIWMVRSSPLVELESSMQGNAIREFLESDFIRDD